MKGRGIEKLVPGDFAVPAERASLGTLSLGLIPVSFHIVRIKIKLTITNIQVLLCFVLKGPPKIYALKGWSSAHGMSG